MLGEMRVHVVEVSLRRVINIVSGRGKPMLRIRISVRGWDRQDVEPDIYSLFLLESSELTSMPIGSNPNPNPNPNPNNNTTPDNNPNLNPNPIGVKPQL